MWACSILGSLPAQAQWLFEAPARAIVRFETGFDFATGDYGQPIDSDTLSVPLGISVERGPWVLGLRTSWLRVAGPGDPRNTPITAPLPGSSSEAGLDDISVSLSYLYVPDRPAWPFVSVGLDVKAPVASRSRRLGTGEPDVSGWLDLSRSFGRRFVGFAGAGYSVFGDGADFVLEDGFYANAGADCMIGSRGSLGLAFGWQQSAVDGQPDVFELSPYASFSFGRVSLEPYLSAGLSESAADLGAGLQISVELLRLRAADR